LEELLLITESKKGNKSALNTLLQQNYKPLYGFVLKMTVNEDLTDDIVQDTLLKVVLNIKSFKEQCKFSTWLIQISINIYKDHVKKNKNIEIEAEDSIISLNSKDLTEDSAILRLQLETALKSLKDMPYKKRTAFILKHYYGYSLEEISKIMDCPRGTVKSRISTTVEALRKVLQY
jgi:RNA polymerase sigma-70 factor, ECF subfamily